jgi:predicted HTH transcriptional regulator
MEEVPLATESPKTHEKFLEYYHTLWQEDDVHTTRDLTDYFQIEFRLARYHLVKMVDEGLLCQVKFEGNTWYFKRVHYAEFESLRPYIHVR